MALALDGFEALCGFVSVSELKQAFTENPELRLCVGEEVASAFAEASDDMAKAVSAVTTMSVPECIAQTQPTLLPSANMDLQVVL